MNDMSLREHLLAAQAAGQAQGHTHSSHDQLRPPGPTSPSEHNIDPAIAGTAYAMSAGESGGDETSPDTKKTAGKRELSTSKRAAQNRAAQRAFRQRKEGYIKRLEEQVKDYQALEANYKAIQSENYQLRDYVINLQSRLIENQQEFPQPPPAIDLSNPRSGEQVNALQAPTATMGPAAVNQLQAAAVAAAADELGGSTSFSSKRAKVEGRPEET